MEKRKSKNSSCTVSKRTCVYYYIIAKLIKDCWLAVWMRRAIYDRYAKRMRAWAKLSIGSWGSECWSPSCTYFSGQSAIRSWGSSRNKDGCKEAYIPLPVWARHREDGAHAIREHRAMHLCLQGARRETGGEPAKDCHPPSSGRIPPRHAW